MRDPSKSIPGLTQDQEQQGGYSRVQADLTKPESLTAAVKTSGATRAFIYLTHASSDHMRSSLEALKAAGIEFVVFLSSFSIAADGGGEPRNVPQHEIISYRHAQVEINLDEVFGPEHYVALRVGGFATNLLRYKDGVAKGEVSLHGGGYMMDFITPGDMGGAGGTILATQTGPRGGQGKVDLFGPQRLSLVDAIGVIGRVLGREVKISGISDEEAVERYAAGHMPRPLAEYMVRKWGGKQDMEREWPEYEEGVENVKRYTGKPAMRLEEWIEANKEAFGG